MTRTIIQLDENVFIEKRTSRTVAKIFCDQQSTTKCSYLFRNSIEKYGDQFVGIILLFFSLLTFTLVLLLMVKLLKSIIIGFVDDALRKILKLNAHGWRNYVLGYVFIFLAIISTILVQSSSNYLMIIDKSFFSKLIYFVDVKVSFVRF